MPETEMSDGSNATKNIDLEDHIPLHETIKEICGRNPLVLPQKEWEVLRLDFVGAVLKALLDSRNVHIR